ncbi:MAG TPA: hypothetical protein PKC43_08505 [Phycisphaerales bacterium]|nr:hypothetical protein [Phycisphaerales bacterium]HMP37476.1 hypothetical protein [Phycisphaerales bacterium]
MSKLHSLSPALAAVALTLSAVPATAIFGASPASCPESAVRINEIRVSHPGMPQNNEYVELAAQPGASLDCAWYVVLGPGGVVEELISLSGAIGPSGLYLIAEAGFNPSAFPGAPTPDLVTALDFADSGNRTHLLVCACGGLPGVDESVDLDADDDGTIDWPLPLWDAVLDCIAIVQNPTGAPTYCAARRGPTSTGNAPPHVHRCQIPLTDHRPWRIGAFPLPPIGNDSPDLANPACTGGPIFGGLLIEPIGAATLTFVGGSLVLSELGGPGSGAGIDVGLADAICAAIDVGPLMAADGGIAGGSGDAPSLTMTGLAPDGAMLASAVYRRVGPGHLGMSVSFGGGDPGSLVVAALQGGAIVATTALLPTPPGVPPIIIEWPLPGPDGPIINDIHHLPDGVPGGHPGWTATFNQARPVSIATPGLGTLTVDADQLAIFTVPNDPSAEAALARVELRCTGFDALPINEVLLREFGNPHKALGDVLMAADGGPATDRIVFQPLPGADLFGTRIGLDYGPPELPGPEIIGIIVRPEVLGITPPDSSIALAPGLVHSGGHGSQLGVFTEQGSQTGTSLIADFSPLNPSALEWLGMLGGSQVGRIQTAGPFANLQVAPNPIALFRYKFEVDGSNQRLYVRKCYQHPFFTPLFSTFVDEIVLCVPAPQLPPYGGAAMRLDLLVAGLPAFALVEETPIVAPPPPCPADLNGDGEVGGADLGALLGSWGQPGPTDLTGDGTSDGADLGVLLSAWGACQ